MSAGRGVSKISQEAGRGEQEVAFSLSLSAVCRESVCQDMSSAVLSEDPKVSVFKGQNGSLCNTKTNLKIWLRMWHRLGVHFVHQKGP